MPPKKNLPPPIKSVAIYCHHKPEKAKQETVFLRQLLRFLHAKGVKEIHGDLRVVTMLQSTIKPINDENRYDLKIGLGGDGTLLKMIRTLQKKDGPLVGINFGTLGFLSELRPDNALEGLEKVWQGEFTVDERMLLKSFVFRHTESGKRQKIFRAYGLNEIVFGHGGQARLTSFNVKVNRRFLSTYCSDGLIFSTPTGSTAYAMSAGGPIMSPRLSAICITPVAPHRLTHRPIVLPGDGLVHLNFDARVDTISMTIDGQIHFLLKSTDQISVQQATRTARFVRLKKSYYFRTLRNKLGWGEK